MHGDDQINIFKVKEYYVFTVADGVSECQFGRIASVMACSAFEKFFKEEVSISNQPNLELVITECFNKIGKTLVGVKHDLGEALDERNIDSLIGYIKDFLSEKRYLEETPENVISDKISELKEKLRNFIKSDKDFSFETTLGVAVVTDYKLYTAVLGDTEIYVFRKNKLSPHYVLPKSETLETYLSSEKGVVGPMDFAMRKLEKDDIVIICSDGANLSYAPSSGYPYALFINTLIKSLKNKENPAYQWFNRLNKECEGKLPDDFSLIIVEVQ
jgi:serine/threonine protein phosphatase PrpC